MNRTPKSAYSCAVVGLCALVACNDEVDTGIPDLTGVPAFAVHRSDYESAAVALLDGDGALLDASYISSGTRTPGLNAALHGDISLPTTPCVPDALVVIARKGGDYLLEVDLETDEVTRQVATQQSDLEDEAAYRANPQDVLCLEDDVALVTRFAPNPSAGDDDLDQGDDIAVIDLQDEEITGRIDLSEVRTMVQGEDDAGGPIEELAYARPTSIVRVGGFAVVGLARMSEGFIAAPGMVAVIDVAERTLHATHEVEGLRNCVGVEPVVGRSDAVIVQCSGYPYGDAASAGIALLAVDEDGDLVEEAALRDQDAPALFSSAVSLGGSRMIAVAQGDWDEMTGDEAFVVDLDSGDREALFTAGGPGAIGTGAFRSETGLLLIPDADEGVRLFDVTDDELSELEVVEIDSVLPARTVRAIRP